MNRRKAFNVGEGCCVNKTAMVVDWNSKEAIEKHGGGGDNKTKLVS